MNNKSINLEIEELRFNLCDIINKSNFPIAIAYYVCKDILKELEQSYYKMLKEEMQQSESKEDQNLNNKQEEDD